MLLAVLGLAPRPARYVLGEREADARLAPVALLDLLPPADRPHRVVAFCTPEATEQSWPCLEAALRDRCQVERIDVPGGMTQDGVDTYLARVSSAIADRDIELTVDVTHGPRHFSFLTYIAVLYLAALRDVRVRGAYYSLPRENAASPFLDLRPLLGPASLDSRAAGRAGDRQHLAAGRGHRPRFGRPNGNSQKRQGHRA